MPDFNNMPELNIGLMIFSSLVTLFLLMGILYENKRSRPFMTGFIILLITNIVMQLGEIGIWVVQLRGGSRALLQICSFLSFGGGSVIMGTYTYCLIGFVRERKQVSYAPANIISIVCATYLIILFISMFNGMIFSVNSKGEYVDGPLGFISWRIGKAIDGKGETTGAKSHSHYYQSDTTPFLV